MKTKSLTKLFFHFVFNRTIKKQLKKFVEKTNYWLQQKNIPLKRLKTLKKQTFYYVSK